MGFGVGIAIGPAAVGTPMLVDAVVTKRVKQSIAPVSFGERTNKGYDHPLQVFATERIEGAIRYPDCGWCLP